MNSAKYICARPYGYDVKVQRLGVVYRASVCSGQNPAALARALALRDQFLALAGEVQARSNTGIIGISELVKFKRSVARPVFSVSHGPRGARKRLFYYGANCRTREAALQLAIRFRQQSASPIRHSPFPIHHS